MNKLLMLSAYNAMIAASLYSQGGSNVFAEEPTRRENPCTDKRTWEERRRDELASKGLKEFVINGQKIYAHNENEARKRYKHRNP